MAHQLGEGTAKQYLLSSEGNQVQEMTWQLQEHADDPHDPPRDAQLDIPDCHRAIHAASLQT